MLRAYFGKRGLGHLYCSVILHLFEQYVDFPGACCHPSKTCLLTESQARGWVCVSCQNLLPIHGLPLQWLVSWPELRSWALQPPGDFWLDSTSQQRRLHPQPSHESCHLKGQLCLPVAVCKITEEGRFSIASCSLFQAQTHIYV